MKKFLTKVSNVSCPKNKLETAIQSFLKENDRLLVDEKDLKIFKENINSHIVFLNQLHKRSVSKTPRWYEIECSAKIKDYSLAGIDCIMFSIYQIQQTYEIAKPDN